MWAREMWNTNRTSCLFFAMLLLPLTFNCFFNEHRRVIHTIIIARCFLSCVFFHFMSFSLRLFSFPNDRLCEWKRERDDVVYLLFFLLIDPFLQLTMCWWAFQTLRALSEFDFMIWWNFKRSYILMIVVKEVALCPAERRVVNSHVF